MWVRRMLALVTMMASLAALTGCSSDKPGPDDVLDDFLDNWQAGTLADSRYTDGSGERIATEYRNLIGDLGAYSPELTADKITEEDGEATATVDVAWTLTDQATWSYRTTVRLVQRQDTWLVDWSARIIHPDLKRGDRLTVRWEQAPRAPILDGSGDPIVEPRPVVHIGVEPQRVTDPAHLSAELARILNIDTTDLPERIIQAQPDAFVEVMTLRREQYDPIRDQLQALPGTVFREDTLPLAPTRQFARALLGTVGPVTAEVLERDPDRYRPGDLAGLSGLQEQYDERLAGTPGVTIEVVRTGQPPRQLMRTEPQAGIPLQVSLDQSVQLAADAALAGESRQTALVALRISDGAVLAVANGPDGDGPNLALEATVAPGSTFKMVTALALLEDGLRPEDTVPCPRYRTVDGFRFSNHDDFALGQVPFSEAFAQSCNTTFVELASRLDRGTLTQTAAGLGIGVPWQLGVDVFTGSVPVASDPVSAAAATFGQGEVTVSPIAMASAVAAVAGGRWQQPRLLLDPMPPSTSPNSELPRSSLEALRSMMRQVVISGTATALADVPGEPVYGKTGSAEYGDHNPPASHAWFVGWQGDLAFAVLVLDGGSGSQTAVPIAERFLRGLAA